MSNLFLINGGNIFLVQEPSIWWSEFFEHVKARFYFYLGNVLVWFVKIFSFYIRSKLAEQALEVISQRFPMIQENVKVQIKKLVRCIYYWKWLFHCLQSEEFFRIFALYFKNNSIFLWYRNYTYRIKRLVKRWNWLLPNWWEQIIMVPLTRTLWKSCSYCYGSKPKLFMR